LLAIIFSLLLSTCETFEPLWVGIWVDNEMTVSMVTITLDFSEDYGTITVENADPIAQTKKTIVKGSLTGDEYTLTATVTYIYAEYNVPQTTFESDDPKLIEAYLITLGLDGLKNSASYRIENNKITLKGKMISVLTGGPDELTAVKQ